MKTDTVNDRCARCSQSEDDLLMDAEAAAKALMRDAAEVTALRARVKELEEAIRLVVRDGCGAQAYSSHCAIEWATFDAARKTMDRPTPSQERP